MCWHCFQAFIRQMHVHTQRAYILYTQVIWITDENEKKKSISVVLGWDCKSVCMRAVCMHVWISVSVFGCMRLRVGVWLFGNYREDLCFSKL